jgi:hypothetical protein
MAAIPNISATDSGPMAANGRSYGGYTGEFNAGGGSKVMGVPVAIWVIGGALMVALLLRKRR